MRRSDLAKPKSISQEVEPAAKPSTDIGLISSIQASEIPETLTLDALEQLALTHNPTLGLAVAEIEKERGLFTQVGLYPNPTVGYVNSVATARGDSLTNGLLVQQTIVTANKLEKARNAEALGIKDGNLQLSAQQARVINDVRLRYHDTIAAKDLLSLAEEQLEISKQSLSIAQRLYGAQQVPETDVLRAEVQLNASELAIQNAKLTLKAAWNQLVILIGKPDLELTNLEPFAEDLPEFGDLEQEWSRLITSSPQLRSAETQKQIAHAEWVTAQANRVPDVTVQMVTQYDSIGNFTTFNSVVALPVPLNNKNQGNIYTAAQEVHRTHHELERVQLVLRDQLVSSLRDYEKARNRVEMYRTEILPRLKRNLELIRKGYDRQELSFLDVLNAQEAFSQSSIQYVNAKHEAWQLAVQLDGLQLTGGLNPAAIGTAIQETAAGSRQRAIQTDLQRQQSGPLKNFAPAALD